jgi:NAD kinase
MAKPRLVIVHRRTELQELLDRHATRGQAEFFLRTRGRSLQDVQERHDRITAALATVRAAIPSEWRQAEVERTDLSRFLLTPEDIIAVVGQDGLVANAAKYLNGQPVIGIDPEPGANPGVLVRHAPAAVAKLLNKAATAGPVQWNCAELATVTAFLDDGQELSALNEVFIGHASHQSARYQPGGAHPSPSSVEDALCRLPRTLGSRGSCVRPGPPPSAARR